MTKQTIGFHWKRITFIFLGLLMLAALIPAVAFGALTGTGTESDPYETNAASGIKIFQTDANGVIQKDLTQKNNGFVVRPGQEELVYLKVTLEDGKTPPKSGAWYQDLDPETKTREKFQFNYYSVLVDTVAGFPAGMKVNESSALHDQNLWKVKANSDGRLVFDLSEMSGTISQDQEIEIDIDLVAGPSKEEDLDYFYRDKWTNIAYIHVVDKIPLMGISWLKEGQVLTTFTGKRFMCGDVGPEPGGTTDNYELPVIYGGINLLKPSKTNEYRRNDL